MTDAASGCVTTRGRRGVTGPAEGATVGKVRRSPLNTPGVTGGDVDWAASRTLELAIRSAVHTMPPVTKARRFGLT